MKQPWIGALLAVLLGLSGCPAGESGQQGPAPLKVAMDPRIGAPFVYAVTAESGEYGGFEVEICRYLAAKLKRPLQIVPVRWPQLSETVRRKQADLALNAIEQPPKGQEPPDLVFSAHYYTAFQQLAVASKDKFTYNLSDLKGKKVGVVDGSVAQLLLQEFNRLKDAKIAIQPFATPEEAFSALSAGRLQATLTERAFASWYNWKNTNIRLTGEPITDEIPYVAMLRADNGPLLKAVNELLIAARKDPEFKRIFDKWHVSIKR